MTILARRFIIICLFFVIFAMLMAAAVANSGRSSTGGRDGANGPCASHFASHCRFRR